jgi:hypothetical protein
MGWQDAPIVKGSWQDAPLVNKAAQSTAPVPQPEIEKPDPVSNWAVMGESLSREMPSNILGLPMDMVNLFANTVKSGGQVLMGKGDQPYQPIPAVGGSEFFKENLFDEVADREDYDASQRLLGNVTTLGSEALTGGAGLAAKAKNIAPIVEGAGSKAAELFGQVVKPYTSRPNTQVMQDTAAGVGAGGGLTVGEEFDLGPIGTLFTTLLGGAGGIGAAKTAESTGRMINANRSTMLPDGTEVKKQTLSDASQIAGDVVTDRKSALENIDQSIADSDELGLANPTLGPASGDVGLSMLEVKQRTKNPQPFAEQDQKIRTGVANKFGEFSNPDADVTAPQRASSQLIDQELGQKQAQVNDLTSQRDMTEQQLTDLQRQGQDVVAPIQARRGAEGRASSQLNEQLSTALDDRTKLKNTKFDEAADGAFVEAKSLASLVDEVNAQAPKLAPDARLPDYIMAGIKKFIPQPGTLEGPNSTAGMIPADEVLKLRQYLNTEIQSLKQKGDFTKADTLQAFKSRINETIEADPQFKEANDFYKTEYAPFFATKYGKKYRDTVQRGQGIDKSDVDNIASIFMKTKSAKDDLDNLRKIAPDQQAFDGAQEMYFDAMLARKGNLTPKVVQNFLADNSDILSPALVEKYKKVNQELLGNVKAQDATVQSIKDLGKQIRQAEVDLFKTERDLTSGPLGKMARYDSDRYVADIMGAKDRNKQIAEIKQKIGNDKEAMDGFKEATVRWMQKKIKGTDASATDIPDTDLAGRPILYSKLTKTLDDNRDALSEIFSPEEMNTLTRMQRVMSRQGNLSRRATSGSDTAEKLTQAEQQVMDVVEASVKLKFGMLTGGGIFRSVKLLKKAIFGESGRAVRADELLTRMAFDPKVAKHVLEAEPLQLENGKWLSELNQLLAVQSGTARAAEDEDE